MPRLRAATGYLDSVDFNKNCEEARGLRLPKSGESVRYYLCDACGFCFAPDIVAWSAKQFEQKIYNDEYAVVDPDYSRRPTENADCWCDQTFGAARVSHIDYGGGYGLLSRLLRAPVVELSFI